MASERNIVCTCLHLLHKMQVLRLDFEEEKKMKKGTKRIFFSRDLVLDDFKLSKVKELYDDEGNLIHQNPVFISGHFREKVMQKICAAITCELYTGRNPQKYLTAMCRFHRAALRMVADSYGVIDGQIAKVKEALQDVEIIYNGPEYSPASLRLYTSVKGILNGFGRELGEDTLEDFDNDTE